MSKDSKKFMSTDEVLCTIGDLIEVRYYDIGCIAKRNKGILTDVTDTHVILDEDNMIPREGIREVYSLN